MQPLLGHHQLENRRVKYEMMLSSSRGHERQLTSSASAVWVRVLVLARFLKRSTKSSPKTI